MPSGYNGRCKVIRVPINIPIIFKSCHSRRGRQYECYFPYALNLPGDTSFNGSYVQRLVTERELQCEGLWYVVIFCLDAE